MQRLFLASRRAREEVNQGDLGPIKIGGATYISDVLFMIEND